MRKKFKQILEQQSQDAVTKFLTLATYHSANDRDRYWPKFRNLESTNSCEEILTNAACPVIGLAGHRFASDSLT